MVLLILSFTNVILLETEVGFFLLFKKKKLKFNLMGQMTCYVQKLIGNDMHFFHICDLMIWLTLKLILVDIGKW